MRKIVFLLILALTTVAGVKLGAAQPATSSGTVLDALPDGSAVLVMDFQKIVGSSLWPALTGQEKLKGAFDKAQSEMTDLGLKMSDVNTVAILFPGKGTNNPAVALTGGFDRNDLLARLRANPKVKLTSEKYKDLDIYRVRSSAYTAAPKPASPELTVLNKDDTSFFFFAPNTLVAGNSEAVRASADVKSGTKPSMAQNVKLADALAQNPAAAIRFALTLTPAMTSGLHSPDLPLPEFSSITLIFGTIDVGAGIDLNATLRSDNAEHAKALAEQLNAVLTMAKGLLGSTGDSKMTTISEALKTVSISAADADVKITGSLPMDLLNSLLSSAAKKTR